MFRNLFCRIFVCAKRDVLARPRQRFLNGGPTCVSERAKFREGLDPSVTTISRVARNQQQYRAEFNYQPRDKKLEL